MTKVTVCSATPLLTDSRPEVLRGLTEVEDGLIANTPRAITIWKAIDSWHSLRIGTKNFYPPKINTNSTCPGNDDTMVEYAFC